LGIGSLRHNKKLIILKIATWQKKHQTPKHHNSGKGIGIQILANNLSQHRTETHTNFTPSSTPNMQTQTHQFKLLLQQVSWTFSCSGSSCQAHHQTCKPPNLAAIQASANLLDICMFRLVLRSPNVQTTKPSGNSSFCKSLGYLHVQVIHAKLMTNCTIQASAAANS
jgi:hypothetical protein